MLLQKESKVFALAAAQCPHSLVPNDEGSGYYHSLLMPPGSSALVSAHLNTRETLAAVQDLSAALRSGALDVKQTLAQLDLYREPRSPEGRAAIFGLLSQVSTTLVKQNSWPALPRLVRAWWYEHLPLLRARSK